MDIVEKFKKEMDELRAEYLAYYGQFIKKELKDSEEIDNKTTDERNE